jgi:hypothetical protein
VETPLPVARDTAGGPWHWLVEWMVLGGCQPWTNERLFRPVIPKPVLARLKAPNDRMPRFFSVLAGVLVGRAVATSNVTTAGAPPQVEPPAVGCEAFEAPGTTWCHFRFDLLIVHYCRTILPGLGLIRD